MSADGLIPWVDEFPAYRERFYSLGFELPRLALNCIESVRKRGEGEKSYDRYCDDVFKEILSIVGPWNYTARKNCSDSVRSPYIDSLVAAIQAGTIRIPENFPLHIVLDPNEIELVQRLGDRDYAKEFFEPLVAQKEVEAKKFWPQVFGLDPTDQKLNIRTISKLLDVISRQAGFDGIKEPTGKEPHILLESWIGDGKIPIYLMWGDLSALKKRGDLNFFFTIGAVNGKRFAMEQVLANGGLYRSRVTNISLVALCISAHVNFLRIWTA